MSFGKTKPDEGSHGVIELRVSLDNGVTYGRLQRIDSDNELGRKGAFTRARNARRHWQDNYKPYADAKYRITEDGKIIA